jgi:hypothetical protein
MRNYFQLDVSTISIGQLCQVDKKRSALAASLISQRMRGTLRQYYFFCTLPFSSKKGIESKMTKKWLRHIVVVCLVMAVDTKIG